MPVKAAMLFVAALVGQAGEPPPTPGDAPMRFVPETPGWNRDVNVLYARGRITGDTAGELQRALGAIENRQYVYWIAFDSGGGDLFAAVALGRLIRQENLRTTVVDAHCRDGASAVQACEPGLRVARGRCVSACAYAFLGGIERRLALYDGEEFDVPAADNEARLGFHQFHGGMPAVATAGPEGLQALGALASASTQHASSALAQYVSDMGVEISLLGLASNARPDNMVFPSRADLARMRVIMGERFLPFRIVPDGQTISAVSIFSSGGAETEQLSFRCGESDQALNRPRFVYSRAQVRHGRIWLTRGTVQVPAEISSIDSLRAKSGSDPVPEPGRPLTSDADWDAYAAEIGPMNVVRSVSLVSAGARQLVAGNDVRMFADANWSHIVIWPSREIMTAVLASGEFTVGFDAPNYTNLALFPPLRFSEEDRRNIAAAVRPCLAAAATAGVRQ